MNLMVVSAAVSGLVLLFLSGQPNRWRAASGVSSLFSAAYIFGITESLKFVEVFGMFGFFLWLGSLVFLAVSLVDELLNPKEKMMKIAAISCVVVSAISNGAFIFLFVQAAGLGIV